MALVNKRTLTNIVVTAAVLVVSLALVIGFTWAQYAKSKASAETSRQVATTAQAEATQLEDDLVTAPARKSLAGTEPAKVVPPKLKVGQKMALLRMPHTPPLTIKEGTNDLDRETSILNTGAAVHYVDSAKWFGTGVFAMSGHRTTYGAAFNKLDLMKAGDTATVRTADGTYRYEYRSTKIVTPDETWVITPLERKAYKDLKDGGLVMTACHPKHSARQRIVVFWKLADFTPAS